MALRNSETVPSTEKRSWRWSGLTSGETILVVVLQYEGTEVAPDDFRVVEREPRVDDITADHAVGFGEVVLVVAVRAAERDNGGDGVATAASAS